MDQRRRRGLLKKLSVLMCGVAIALLCGTMFAEWQLTRLMTATHSENIGATIGKRLSLSLWRPLSEGDNADIAEIILAEASDPFVAGISVFPAPDPDSSMVVPNPGTPALFTYWKNGEERAQDMSDRIYSAPKQEIVDSTLGRTVGFAKVYVDKAVVADDFYGITEYNFLKGVILVAILALIVSLLLNHFMIRPMTRLNQLIVSIRRAVRSGKPLDDPPVLHIEAQVRRIPLYFSELQDMGHGLAELAAAFYERQASLEESEERLTIILNAIGDAVIATDADGTVTRLNPAAERLLGVSAHDVIGRPYRDFYRIRDEQSGNLLVPMPEYVLTTGEATERSNPAILSALDGVERIITGLTHPLFGKDDQLAGCVISLHDITGSHRLESQMKLMQKMNLVDELAGGLAHDLNNLATGLNGAVELLNATSLDVKQREYTALIAHTTQSMGNLVRDLLGFARTGKREQKPLDVNEMVRTAAALVQPSLCGVKIYRQFCPYRMVVSGDATQLQNAILNLALNARDAMPGGGTLSFRTKLVQVRVSRDTVSGLPLDPGAYAMIGIEDTGCGISKQDLEHIFEPFFTTKERGRGTGLGLPVSYSVVKNHGGAIDVRTAVGAGTVFEIYLPIVAATPDEAQGLESTGTTRVLSPLSFPEPASDDNAPRVLLIDDDPMIRRLTADILAERHYDVDIADDALSAEEKIRASDYALVIVDLIMPGFVGSEFIRDARVTGIQTPFILASGFDDSDPRIVFALTCPNVKFLKKPFNIRALMSLVESFIPPNSKSE